MALKLSASTEKEANVEAGFDVLHMTHEIYHLYFEIYERKKRMIKHTCEWGEHCDYGQIVEERAKYKGFKF